MKQTTVKIEGMKSIVGDAGVERQIKRGDGGVRENTNFLSGTATVRAMGQEGHVMPSSPKPSAVKPAKEKIKPKAPPTAKPPAKKAQSRRRAARSHRGRWCAPTSSVWCSSTSSRTFSAGLTTPAEMSG